MKHIDGEGCFHVIFWYLLRKGTKICYSSLSLCITVLNVWNMRQKEKKIKLIIFNFYTVTGRIVMEQKWKGYR